MHSPTDLLIDSSIRKEQGIHYTPKLLADFVAAKIASNLGSGMHGRIVKIFDPAVGDGELLASLASTLLKNGHSVSVEGTDTSEGAIKVAQDRLRRAFPKVATDLRVADFLESHSFGQRDLFSQAKREKYDAIIANPPYVRTQVLGSERSRELAARFDLTGRVDLYHVFLKAMSQLLTPEGVAGIIVSNRFMSTRSGAAIREAIQREFELLQVWDLGDTKLFEAAVLPAVLLMRLHRGKAPAAKFTTIYQSKDDGKMLGASNAIEALNLEGLVKVEDGRRFRVTHGELAPRTNGSDVWAISTKEKDSWLEAVKARTALEFKDIGKVRVGVKTTADEVFISRNWHLLPTAERPELLRPLMTHHAAKRWIAKSPLDHKILYPYESENGKRKLLDLGKFPKTRKYFERHRNRLESRTYVIEGGRKWFEIWVPQKPALWEQPKIIFRDISDRPEFWIDVEGTIVNGDCYWLTPATGSDTSLLWLALAVGNSTFIEAYYDHRFNNKLYSGRRRFITQYVNHFPLPDPKSQDAMNIVKLAKKITAGDCEAHAALESEIDELVWKAFGLKKEVVR